MDASWLECDGCGSRFEVAPLFFGCPECARTGKKRPLEMKYAGDFRWPAPARGVWRWADLLPHVDEDRRVTLQEGDTPLLLIGDRLFLKNETVNPTWSWKDRPNAVSVSMAKRFGFTKVLAKSTGNHGNATAAYAAAGGLSATVFCNPATSRLQLALMEGYGARVILGGDQDETIAQWVAEGGYFPSTVLDPHGGYANPFGVEGFKTLAFEIVEALAGEAPDRVFVAAGSGDGIYGIWKGFRELAERNLIRAAPRMIGCQPCGANSASLAWQKGARHVEPLSTMHTSALSVAEPATGDHALRAVYESQGEFREASEQEIQDAAGALRRKGLAVELASALPYACILQENGRASRDISIGSGAAVKWPETLMAGWQGPLD